jgi:hypothetical protein
MVMSVWSPVRSWLRQPIGPGATWAVACLVCVAPAWLFFDATSAVARDPLAVYRMISDDFPYVAGSRTLRRAVSNLFVPHNTHIAPAWRMLTWVLAASAGRLVEVPRVLATASYAILVAVMLLTMRLVARETGRTTWGLAAMAAVGTSSLMMSAATWYSAGQTLWAGYGILAALWFAQGWRRSGGGAWLILTWLSAAVAGWFWTVGYLAGPVTAAYLWVDGRARCRKAAVVPLVSAAMAAAIAMGLGASQIDATISFHGRSTLEAINPVRGITHTFQAITENLILGNLGLVGWSMPMQATVIALGVLAAWLRARRRRGWRFNPLETAGAVLVLSSYWVEWTVRGYFAFANLRGIVPWYETIPQIGAVLFVAGWWSGPRAPLAPARPAPTTRAGALGVVLLAASLVAVNQPRVNVQWRDSVPKLLPSEIPRLPYAWMHDRRTNKVSLMRAAWQRRFLAKLDQAEAVARQQGMGRNAIALVFGRIAAPLLPPVYDAADLLDLPRRGGETDLALVLRTLAPYFALEPDPRPAWLLPDEIWPPETYFKPASEGHGLPHGRPRLDQNRDAEAQARGDHHPPNPGVRPVRP